MGAGAQPRSAQNREKSPAPGKPTARPRPHCFRRTQSPAEAADVTAPPPSLAFGACRSERRLRMAFLTRFPEKQRCWPRDQPRSIPDSSLHAKEPKGPSVRAWGRRWARKRTQGDLWENKMSRPTLLAVPQGRERAPLLARLPERLEGRRSRPPRGRAAPPRRAQSRWVAALAPAAAGRFPAPGGQTERRGRARRSQPASPDQFIYSNNKHPAFRGARPRAVPERDETLSSQKPTHVARRVQRPRLGSRKWLAARWAAQAARECGWRRSRPPRAPEASSPPGPSFLCPALSLPSFCPRFLFFSLAVRKADKKNLERKRC